MLKPGEVYYNGCVFNFNEAADLMDEVAPGMNETVHNELVPCTVQAFWNRWVELAGDKAATHIVRKLLAAYSPNCFVVG